MKQEIQNKYMQAVEKEGGLNSKLLSICNEKSSLEEELGKKDAEFGKMKKEAGDQEKLLIATKLELAESTGNFDQLQLKNRILEQDYVSVKLKLAEACANLDDCRAIVANFAKPKSSGRRKSSTGSVK